MSASWVGRCDHLEADDLYDYDDTAEDINYHRFKHYVGQDEIDRLEEEYGYKGSGLTLENDWHISYSQGKWKGKWAVCMMWSAYHHIWIIDE